MAIFPIFRKKKVNLKDTSVTLAQKPRRKTIIQGYGEGGFRVNGDRYEGAILLTPDTVHTWHITSFDQITESSLNPLYLAGDEIQLLIIGSGRKIHQVPSQLYVGFREKGISTEVMDTGAACRTYNILLSELRPIAAALFPE